MTTQFIIRKIHKWMGLLVAIQILLWIVGGVVMSSIPIGQVRGDHSRAFVESYPLNFKEVYPLEKVLPSVPNPIESITLENGDRGLVYNIKIQEWRNLYYDALTGKDLDKIDRANAEKSAAINYRGKSLIKSTNLVEDRGGEYKGIVPAWRVEFDDWESTAFYIEQDSGKISASRNTMWRIYDFVWMLHIMDYDEREDFNHPLLIAFASTSLLFVFTGIFLLFQSQYRRDLRKLISK